MVDNEVAMTRAGARVSVLVGAVLVVGAGALRGLPGAATALGAAVLVGGNFVLTGRSLAWAARRSPTVLQAVALGGFFVRLVVYAVGTVLLRDVEAVDGPVLAASVVAATVVLLAYEARLALRHQQLWWVVTPVAAGTPTNRKERA